MQGADRLQGISPYIFAQLEQDVAEVRARGLDVVDLSMSDPDRPAPTAVRERLLKAAVDERAHRYPPYRGREELRTAIARFYKTRFNVDVDPEREVYVLAGSKEGLAHLPLALLNPGDVALVPDPGYPTYHVGCRLAGADVVPMPLEAKNDFLPDFAALSQDILERARLVILNYPNNPTGAVAPRTFLAEVARLAARYDWTVLYDSAYAEITFDGYEAPSLLEMPTIRQRAVESLTFSKAFNMQGFRLGALVGAPAILDLFARVETNVMAGVYDPIQRAGAAALEIAYENGFPRRMAALYRERQAIILQSLAREGIMLNAPLATVYVWVPVPAPETSVSFARRLLNEAGVAVSPGSAFGNAGEGYVRIALTADAERCREAARRWQGLWQRSSAALAAASQGR